MSGAGFGPASGGAAGVGGWIPDGRLYSIVITLALSRLSTAPLLTGLRKRLTLRAC